jgi:hypothetical protein
MMEDIQSYLVLKYPFDCTRLISIFIHNSNILPSLLLIMGSGPGVQVVRKAKHESIYKSPETGRRSVTICAKLSLEVFSHSQNTMGAENN